MRTAHFITILFAAYLFFACNNTTESKVDTNKDSASHPVTHSDTSPAVQPPAADENFTDFWQNFRNVVLGSDMAKVTELTEFPFRTRGPMDEDPVIKYDQSQFARVFNLFLRQSNGIDLDKTVLDDVKKIITPNRSDIRDDYARIGDMEFRKKDKKWKLAFAYLNDETIDKLGK